MVGVEGLAEGRFHVGDKVGVRQGLAGGGVLKDRGMNRSDQRHGFATGAADPKYAARSLAILAEARRSVCVRINPRHTACTDGCRLWMSKREHACVCMDSGNVHLCGKDCNLPSVVSMDNDGYVCPLTHMVLEERVCVQVPRFDGNGRAVRHWESERVRRKERNAAAKKRKRKRASIDLARRITEDALRVGDAARRERAARDRGGRGCASFEAMQAAVHKRAALVCTRQPASLVGVAEGVAAVVQRYIDGNRKMRLGSADATVATLLSLLGGS